MSNTTISPTPHENSIPLAKYFFVSCLIFGRNQPEIITKFSPFFFISLLPFCVYDPKKNCTKITFENVRCHNGDCVLASQRCDRNQDCRDLSDEVHCGKFT